ncbi:MAG: serine hydrolase domain-containing protein, partial [Umezawaea sp.]
ERFAYNNGGYVVLALIAERASGTAFHDLVRDRVCAPAGMVDTEFLRSDHATGRTALGYLPDGRTNVFHLPVRGSGDGGIYSTAADFSAFWRALFDGRIVAEKTVAEMIRPRSDVPGDPRWYGMGFWLPEPAGVQLEGYDVGVSFRSTHDPATGLTTTVLSNTANGAWPLVK